MTARPRLNGLQASRGRRFVFSCVLLLSSLVAGLLIAEVAARMLDLRPASLRSKRYLQQPSVPGVTYHCYSSNPNGEFQRHPDTSVGEWRLLSSSLLPTSAEIPLSRLDETPWCVEDRLSDQGLRDRHYDPQPPPGKLRIAVIGDSFVRGEGVPVERSLPKQMEAMLGAERYEIANIGFIANGTADEVTTAREAVALLNVQRILLVFIPNDVRLTEELEQRQEYINDLINIRDERLAIRGERMWYRGHLRVVQLIGSLFEMRRISQETVAWYLDSYDPARNPEGLRLLAEDLRTLAGLRGCRPAVVIYPLMFGLEDAYPLSPIHDRVAQMVKAAGLPVLDLAPAFEGLGVRSLQVHPADHHPNGRAHAIAARAITEWLRRELPDFLVPGPAAGPP